MNIEIKNFLDVVADKSGGNTKIPQANFQKTGQYPIIDQGKEFIAGYTDDETALLKSTSLPVIIFGDHTKIIKYADFPFALGADGVKVLKPSAEAHPKYIYHFLKSVHILDAGYSRHFKFLKETKIPLPPLPTQTHIAHLLDKADELRQKRQTAIKKLDDLLQATFIKMFGDPVVNDKGWKVIKLDKLGKWASGGTPSRSNQSFFNGDIAWYTSGELNDIYVSDSIEKISQQAIEQSSAKPIPVGSLLLGMYDTAGLKSSITTIPSSCNQAIAFAKIDENIANTKFVYHNIQLCKEYLKNQQRGVRQKNFNLSMIKNIEVLNPSLELQTQFAHIATHIETQKAKLQAQADELEGLFLSLQQRAFDGRLTNFTP